MTGGGLNAKAHKACVREAGNQACKARLQEEETYLKREEDGQAIGTDGQDRGMAIGHPQSL